MPKKKKKKDDEGFTLLKALRYLKNYGEEVGFGGKAGSYLESGAKKKKRYDRLTGAGD